jgi:hypothetical protein
MVMLLFIGSKTMKVFRLEHNETKRGPYEHPEYSFHHLIDKTCKREYSKAEQKYNVFIQIIGKLGFHEDPFNMIVDNNIEIQKSFINKLSTMMYNHWVFGWVNQEDFEFFCPQWLFEKLKPYGFVINIYETDDFLMLKDEQVIFNPNKAVLIELEFSYTVLDLSLVA